MCVVKLLSSRNLAAHLLIPLDDFLFATCPISQNRERDKARLNDESESGLVLERDGDFKKLQIGREFDAVDDLIFDFGEVCEFSQA